MQGVGANPSAVSVFGFSFFTIAFLLLSGAVVDRAKSNVLPVGTDIGPIQFDAVIEINPPLAPTHIILFARYWVATNFYRAAVVWAEPHSSHLWFPIYPPTLSIGSDDQSFDIMHGLNTNKSARFTKPIGPRGIFDSMYGDYPISKIRFAEEEALVDRLYEPDSADLEKSNSAGLTTTVISLTQTNKQRETEIAKIEISRGRDTAPGLVDSITLLGGDDRLLKRVTYAYDQHPPQLTSENVLLAERPIRVGSQHARPIVKNGETNYEFKTAPMIHEPGGRNCSVTYGNVRLGDATARLPVRIDVRAGAGAQIIRSVTMTDFKRFTGGPGEAQTQARAFADFTPSEREYRALLIKYWQKQPSEVSDEDASSVKRLREVFSQPLPIETTIGSRLKRENMLIELA